MQQTLQNDLNNLIEWSLKWKMTFHPEKCVVMTVGRAPVQERHYHLLTENGPIEMTRTAQERDLGIIWTPDLKFREEIEERVKKANNIVGIVRRSFTYMTATSFKLLFKALVRPHLEYGAPIWNPATLREINRIEGVQRRAIKMLPGMKERSYEERLKAMDLPTLRFLRLRGDLIEAFKICPGLYNYPPEELLPKNRQDNRTRGHE